MSTRNGQAVVVKPMNRQQPRTEKAYTITQPQIAELAEAISLLDWIKNRLPDAMPEKAEAAVAATRCHALLEAVLVDEAPAVYAPEEEETRV